METVRSDRVKMPVCDLSGSRGHLLLGMSFREALILLRSERRTEAGFRVEGSLELSCRTEGAPAMLLTNVMSHEVLRVISSSSLLRRIVKILSSRSSGRSDRPTGLAGSPESLLMPLLGTNLSGLLRSPAT